MLSTAGNDFAAGGFGSDALYGRGGGDILIGGDDNDRLLGGTGGDLLFGGAIDDFAAQDPAILEALWLAIGTNLADNAFDALAGDLGAADDFAVDTLHGEADGDWYLTYQATGDRFTLSSERSLPNRIRDL